MYEQIMVGSALDQGDIIDDCPILLLNAPTIGIDDDFKAEATRARVVVLTQACNLAQGKTTKALVAIVTEAKLLVASGELKAKTISDSIRRHQSFGWYFLPASPPPVDYPESIVDLREIHTVDRRILERLISEGKGVCRLATPYREHLAQHFGVTYMRIGLPVAYESEP